ncbi:AbrB/MazE/SpoVT family DNA-binding domain-containing protein [Salinimicrobium sp. CDJ15-81-2]|uniref:AbrB/MazE/SpoVT family DNA-binding domain-containing protein n=1 Tax=Salinimicrobium oceani TaxID=2722702 RepID=A0ABX1D6Z7_9FLAO|nr:AbrB/MazE/SpoVT family DNA-binding domain-containing protein [Salinimicrobium oceani]NJW54548.1 AbrB/MazE/SpoVT family DNA-binding domain-containing protein [Salinimicrobium oceani]NJY63647.1 AbrB/MazE/SpoVT family DNA-binding domain-containing protein [Salinimicrobium nanhaiense]
MEAKIVKIGNSKGIIIPAELLDLIGLKEKVRLEVKNDQIVISSAKKEAREGWEEMIKAELEKQGQPTRLISDFFEDERNEDWEW